MSQQLANIIYYFTSLLNLFEEHLPIISSSNYINSMNVIYIPYQSCETFSWQFVRRLQISSDNLLVLGGGGVYILFLSPKMTVFPLLQGKILICLNFTVFFFKIIPLFSIFLLCIIFFFFFSSLHIFLPSQIRDIQITLEDIS